MWWWRNFGTVNSTRIPQYCWCLYSVSALRISSACICYAFRLVVWSYYFKGTDVTMPFTCDTQWALAAQYDYFLSVPNMPLLMSVTCLTSFLCPCGVPLLNLMTHSCGSHLLTVQWVWQISPGPCAHQYHRPAWAVSLWTCELCSLGGTVCVISTLVSRWHCWSCLE